MKLLIPIFLLAFSASATVYKTVDKDGVVEFTDQQAPEAQEVQVPKGQTYKHVPVVKETNSSTKKEVKKNITYDIKIISPQNDATITTDVNQLQVRVALAPRLTNKDKLQLFHNGSPLGEPQRRYRFEVLDLERGSHTFSVGIINSDGKVISKSNSITVHQKRASIFSP